MDSSGSDEPGGLWRIGGDVCPRCRYDVVIPLRPSDSRVMRVWDCYCTRCGYTWTRKEPIEDVL